MSLASEGIARPRDLEGKKYGGFGGQLEQQLIESLVACGGGDPSLVEFVEVGNIDYIPGGMDQDRFDFVWVFEGWDVIRARNLEGVEITTLPFIDYTECIPDWYTPVIVAGDDLIAVDPDLVRTFLEVTARGYDFTQTSRTRRRRCCSAPRQNSTNSSSATARRTLPAASRTVRAGASSKTRSG